MLCGVIVVLYPWHKLNYFECAGWKPGWIATARDIIRTEFDRSYAAQPEHLKDDEDKDIEMSENHTTNIFDDLPALFTLRIMELCDKLDRYLGADPEHIVDILMWWIERKSIYPHLSRMALDYLSIPHEFIYII
jgi:hypothetical protein